jgi:hypothetical protein
MKKFLLHLASKRTPQLNDIKAVDAVLRYLDRYFRTPRHGYTSFA